MPRIKQLPPEEAQKIAAGEVIERPANVVKELIENALDAGATRITLFIEKAGKQLIRIIDNGCGMDAHDARACFNHHATSKITSVLDLHTISTLGFRGEALSSIASVSNITLITKMTDAEHAIQLKLSEGRILSEQKVSAPTGTDLAIADLLFNVPVRKKFLKTNDTEWRHILHLVHAVALSRRDLHITLHHDGKQVLNCPPTVRPACPSKPWRSREEDPDPELGEGNERSVSKGHLDRAAQLWDAELAQAMITCSAEERGIRIEGMISDYTAYRYDRNALYFFVNGRWIKNYTLSRALMKGYANAIPAAQFPTASLMITIDPAQIDVNIHPRKEEVLFLHQRIVDQVVQTAVKAALEARLSAQLNKRVQFASTTAYTPYDFVHNPSRRTFGPPQGEREGDIPSSINHEIIENKYYETEKNIISSVRPSFDFAQDARIRRVTPSSPEWSEQSSFPPILPVQRNLDEEESSVNVSKRHNVIGVYDRTYIMIAHEEGILFVDQHAAHERILYEQFKTRFTDTASITLMFPHVLTFKQDALNLIEPYLSILCENGIQIKRTSDTELIITATPVYLKNASLNDLILEMISCISESEDIRKNITEKVHAQMACSAAVKAGDELSSEQIQKLLTDLANTPNRFTCPHGRPTSWLLNHDEIVKKFQRNYQSKKRDNAL